MANNSVVLLGCGDVGPVYDPVNAHADLVKPILAGADLRFAQCERVYSTRGEYQTHGGGGHSRAPASMASIFDECAYDVVSVASNHSMDWGADALLDTIDLFKSKGIKTAGAGRNEEEARQPALIEKNGVKIAFLAYCSVLREGCWAGPKSAGVAPLRAHTYYESVDYQAGVPPKIVTVPHEKDLEKMVADITAAKKSGRVVVVSIHWGVHFVPRMIADYQTIAAKAVFEAGADVLLGHHAHAPKAIEVINNKVCFYSLSNFMMSSSPKSPAKAKVFEKRYGVTLDPDYPHLPYGSDGKRSLIAKVVLTPKGVDKVSFLPVIIDKQLRPEVLHSSDPRFADAVKFMDWVSEDRNHKFTVQGDEVLVQSNA